MASPNVIATDRDATCVASQSYSKSNGKGHDDQSNPSHPKFWARHEALSLFAGMAALAAATLGFASAAGAAGTAPLPQLARPSAGVHPLAAGSSAYLGGYQATPTGGLASASVTFTVPKISCTTTDKNKTAEEWNGVYTDSLNTYALVVGGCLSSGPVYEWQFSTLAGTFDEPGAAAGDVVVASLFQSGSSTLAELHDLTERELGFGQPRQPRRHRRRHRDIERCSSAGNPIPTFTTANFTNATVNGDYLGFDGPTEFNALKGGDLLIKSGKLHTSATGSVFTEAFKKAS